METVVQVVLHHDIALTFPERDLLTKGMYEAVSRPLPGSLLHQLMVSANATAVTVSIDNSQANYT